MTRGPEIALAAAIAALAAFGSPARAEAPFAAVLPAPAEGGAVRIRATPARVLLGEDREVKLDVAVPEGAVRVRLFASAGEIREASLQNPTTFVASYIPPKGFVPRVDVVTAVVETPAGTKVGFTALQLVGQGEAVIRTRPNANARIRIGDREYGPVQADRRGEARIRVQVPPGTKVGTDENGDPVDLGVPPMPRVSLILPVTEIAMDSPRVVPVYAVLTTGDGGADTGQTVSFVTNQGGISEPKALGGGVFVAAYNPPVEGVGEVIIMAAVEGEPLPAATGEIALLPRAGAEGLTAGAAPAEGAPPPPPLPGASHGLSGVLKVGLGWNVGALAAFHVGIDAGYEVRIRSVGLRAGVELGFSETAVTGHGELEAGSSMDVTSAMWLVPMAGYWGCRLPLVREWSLLLRNESAVMLVDNLIRVGNGGTNGNVLHERAWLPAFGGALEIDRDLGPGAFLLELRYLYVRDDLETVDGRLGILYVNLGYRLRSRPF